MRSIDSPTLLSFRNRTRLRAGVALATLCVTLAVCGWAQIGVDGDLSHELLVEPGRLYEGEIKIYNSSEAPTGLAVYQRDYLFFADGRSIYGEPGSVDRSNASWITLFLSPRITLDPGQATSISYKIQVPDDPTLVGTYWSIVMIEPKPPPEVSSEEGLAVRQVIRYAIQIVTHVGDTGKREIEITQVELFHTEEEAILQIDLTNVGEQWVRPEVWTELYDEGGAFVGRFDSTRLRIYPGCSVRHRIALSGINSGRYKALVVFDNGDEYVWAAQYTFKL